MDKCPSCGSSEVTSIVCKKQIPSLNSGVIEYTGILDKCKACEEEGDFDAVEDKVINTLIKEDRRVAAIEMFKYLENIGITRSFFERALRLYVGTTKDWDKKINPVEFGLLYLIYKNPKLLELINEEKIRL